MVYGRYNELDNYGIHGVYKPTNITFAGPILCRYLIPSCWDIPWRPGAVVIQVHHKVQVRPMLGEADRLAEDPDSHKKYWLVVLTLLKNISQWEGLSHI